MFVRARSDAEPIGWAVVVQRMPGRSARIGRRLSMEHCTVQGKGLLDLRGFSPESPCKVEIKGSAALAEALLALETSSPGAPPTPKALDWTGQGNQYDIRGKSWVVLSPEGAPELPSGPTDMTSWSKLAKETDLLPPPIRFQSDPAALSQSPRPQDFGILGQGIKRAGADPSQVGPTGKSAKP